VRYYIIAGEASGDLHGSNLIKELKKIDREAAIRCWGGDKMKAAGGELVKHYREHAYMGFAEVIRHLPSIFKNLKYCKKDIESFKPDVIVLIDYPGFNLRIAKWAKSKGFKIVYYISPQVWAWKENRVKMMKENIDKMLVILPFEKDYFRDKWNWEVEYVGHPLIHEIERRKSKVENKIENGEWRIDDESKRTKIIAVLPGSRKQEIEKKLPVMLSVTSFFPDHQFVIAQAPAIEDEFYENFTSDNKNVSIIKGKTYDLLSEAKAAMVTSGTATLETALFGVPEVVCYKGSYLSYQIGKRLVKVKYISLVNLIMDRLVVKELIQDQLTTENLQTELNELLHNPQRILQLKKDYAELKSKLSAGGNASEKAATAILGLFRSAV
jgi:lipid-A-disaccharide synthase